jgi:hypothetical protein
MVYKELPESNKSSTSTKFQSEIIKKLRNSSLRCGTDIGQVRLLGPMKPEGVHTYAKIS